jgi:uncharacterized membrane protein
MADFESLLKRWQSVGVLDADAAARIRAYESEQERPSGLRLQGPQRQVQVAGVAWQGRVALILGAILLASGVALFVSAHWDELGPGWRYTIVMIMVAIFHFGGAVAREKYHGLSTALHAVGTISTGAAIALVGQIFNIQEHWPAAILLWAIAALAGWILLRDEAQQSLTLLLFPAWLLCEWSYSANGHIGEDVYFGRFLIVWAVLYLTLFLGSERKIVRGILFAAAAISAVTGIVMLLESWRSWSYTQSYLPLHNRVWGWVDIAALPLLLALFRLRKSLIPVAASLVFAIALPWCSRTWTEYYNYGVSHGSYTRTDPNLAAHALVTAFTIFIIWWGVRESSRALVNLGIVGFAISVGWFYFSDLYDKMGRSLGLIGLGVLFLAGGWALEKTRRSLLAHMAQTSASTQEAL